MTESQFDMIKDESKPIIKISNLSKSFEDEQVLKNINLEIRPKRIVGLLGPNGSGKTTLIKILTGLYKCYEGEVLINDKLVGKETKEIVAYLPDLNFINSNWTIKECISFYKDFFKDFDESKALQLMERFNISKTKKFKQLSKGTKDKVQLILTLSRNALVYIFDEPIAGVDPAAREFIFKLIMDNYNHDSTIIISTHLITDAENILDDVIFIQNGEIKLFGDKTVLENYHQKTIDELFREVFRCY